MDFMDELPEQIFRDILLRVPYKSQSNIKQLLKPAQEMMDCLGFYQDRIKFGTAKKYICFLQDTGISIYDPIDQSLEMLPPIPTGFEILRISQIQCVKHKIVLLGLEHDGSFSKKILIYDLLCSTWKQGAEFPTGKRAALFACCATPQGSIYIAGGIEEDGFNDELSDAAVYRVDEDKWELLPQMQEEIGPCRGVFIEGMFYVIGISNNISQRFDPNTGVWTTIENMSLYNSWHVQLVYDFAQLYAFGRNGMEKYDWKGNMWTNFDFPEEIFFVRATAWCDRIFVCGYNNPNFELGAPVFYMYKPEAAFYDRWISLDRPRQFLEMEVVAVATIEI
ncbi:hypothetical protein SUGI_0701880 [Cryptomeria japonica]|uniref:F-box/kelch-repeat protein At1g80440-like n=1 Tax=Cryptomeria japonica TaxID=3369 RepID=UPI00241480AA|nr:F-box/kelch-repeat protein At1g80440-like [Cryptomeria japonica]GLJ34859.1 hypothetical protein SUGI_0701880 [Cryptomeria japonica]